MKRSRDTSQPDLFSAATGSGLLGGPAPRVRAIPASAPFLDVFVDALVCDLHAELDPFALADALILLPNRRAARGLVDAFARRLGGAALLPSIRPLGDLDDDVDVWGPEPIDLGVAPATAPLRRRMELASLVRAKFRAEKRNDDPVRALALADELCRLMDSAATVDDVDWAKLPTLVDEIDLAEHWQKSADFLDIVARFWPQRLLDDGLADPGVRRSTVLLRLAEEWSAAPPTRPVLIAGSTGSIAATRHLMRVVAGLPRGAVILPGLDRDLDDMAWDKIGPQHPQFALAETLRALELKRADVAMLGAETGHGAARRVLVREALVPADATADWITRLTQAGGVTFATRALDGLSYLEAANQEEEAASIALTLREALEQPGARVALVTPDARLARRVAAKLARWHVQPDLSHGLPLAQTPIGSLLALLTELARDSGDPVALAGLLAHPFAAFGLAPTEFARARHDLERDALRGARRIKTVDDLPKLATGNVLTPEMIGALAPLSRADGMAPFAAAIVESVERIAQSLREDGARVWAGRAGEAAAALLDALITHGAALGDVTARDAARVFAAQLAASEVPPERGGDERCAIWGPLEARLQRRDLVVLGGLNDGTWPAPPHEDAFLSRSMRAALGLPSPDARIGLAAHDFAQLACAPRVVMTRALKQDGSPSVASRWVWRLRALLGGAGLQLAPPARVLDWARALDAPTAPRQPRIPRPRPPADARLKRISVTQVETLIRDPYAIYARRILGLNVLDQIGADPAANHRGTAIHAALEVFGDGDDAYRLIQLLDDELRRAGFDEERRGLERVRLVSSAKAFVAWSEERRARGTDLFIERAAELDLDGVKLTAKADRIEIGASGAAILDYKTGQPPTGPQVESGLAPQLPLEAALLARGAFMDVPKARVSELVYWRFGGADPGARVLKLEKGAHGVGEEAFAELKRLLARYREPAQAFLSKPRVQFAKDYDDYDQLARRKEWADFAEVAE